jgi:hypothetical protein
MEGSGVLGQAEDLDGLHNVVHERLVPDLLDVLAHLPALVEVLHRRSPRDQNLAWAMGYGLGNRILRACPVPNVGGGE